MNSNRFGSVLLVSVLLAAVLAPAVYSHCQVPCGIYNDRARIKMLSENIITIEKAMQQITELSKKRKPDFNQIVRWVDTKEKHSDDIADIVSYYFLTQRLKPVELAIPIDKQSSVEYNRYVKQLILLHEMMYYSMKSKQTTDLANPQVLASLLEEFQEVYFRAVEDVHQD